MSSTRRTITESHAPIPRSMEHIDVAPRARWDLDLTTAAGAYRIQSIFQEIRNVMLNEGASKLQLPSYSHSNTIAERLYMCNELRVFALHDLLLMLLCEHAQCTGSY
jgi:hypothetical protein